MVENSADTILHQVSSYLVICHTSPITGHGIQEAYFHYWQTVFIASYLVCFVHIGVLGYFSIRAYKVSPGVDESRQSSDLSFSFRSARLKLWGSNIWVAAVLSALTVGVTVLGL